MSNTEIQKLDESVYRKINEGLVKRNPNLGLIDEKVVYDKNFLLEVSHAGYDPLDKEDVKNFLEQLPPKNQQRNIILCGADKYNQLGQSEYQEDDAIKFRLDNKLEAIIKKEEDIYLSDLSTKKILLEGEEFEGKDMDKDWEKTKNYKLKKKDIKDYKLGDQGSVEDIHRTGLAKAFGSDDIKPLENSSVSNSEEIQKHNPKLQQMLELIKELKVLGYSNEEIKYEISKL